MELLCNFALQLSNLNLTELFHGFGLVTFGDIEIK